MLMNENTKVKLGYMGTVEGKSMYEMARNNPDMIIDMFKDMEPDADKYCEVNREFFKVNRDVKSYYIFKRSNGVDIFIDMPLVTNTDVFKWTYKEWGRSKSLWTQLTKGYLRFNCMYNLKSKSIRIGVMYDNTEIRNLWVNNGDNEDILNAIEEFTAIFERDICYSTSCAELKNTNRFT